jgi:DNA-binding NarL/FixJ family response regulator
MAVLEGFSKGSATRIVLVDHSPAFRHVAAELMAARADLELIESLEGNAGILTHVRRADPNLVLMGLDGPDGAALRAIPRLRQAMPGVGIIALSLSNDGAYRQAALDAGADALVTKADLVTDLLPAIERLAETRRESQAAPQIRRGQEVAA